MPWSPDRFPAAGTWRRASASEELGVIVGGVTIVENGAMTDARPGQIIRPGADTRTVTVPGS